MSTQSRFRALARHAPAFLAFGSLCLAACAQSANPAEPRHAFPEMAARHLFADGYRHVQERYIDPVSADHLAFAGFDGLSEVAPDIRVRRQGDAIALIAADREVREFPLPAKGDSEAWGRLTAAVLQAGWAASPDLRRRQPEQIYRSMFSGVVEKLDGYSRYSDATSAEQARASREGFGGIGITVGPPEAGRVRIDKLLPDAPAARAGLAERDEIVEIDGEPVQGLEQSEIVDRLRGPVDSQVLLGVLRGGRRLDVMVTRAHIVPNTVSYERQDDIAYFRVGSFNRHTTSDLRQLVLAARREIGPDLKGLILDLRGNPGGLLDQAVSAADLFLDQGTIVATRGRHPASNSVFTATEDDIAEGLPIAVLINGKSASASEMLAAALQDQGRAVVVGSASHGKGSVQNVVRMPNGGELIITWSRMVAPSGYILDRLGVLPAICTSGAAGRDPIAHLPELRQDGARNFAAWHAYTTADEVVARTLRLACPAEQAERDEDIAVAQRLLREPKGYRLALRPWTAASMMAEQAASPPDARTLH